jgi:hypothetical protein
VGEVSKAAIQPLKDVAAPIKTSLSSATAVVAHPIVSMTAGTTNFEIILIFPSCRFEAPQVGRTVARADECGYAFSCRFEFFATQWVDFVDQGRRGAAQTTRRLTRV